MTRGYLDGAFLRCGVDNWQEIFNGLCANCPRDNECNSKAPFVRCNAHNALAYMAYLIVDRYSFLAQIFAEQLNISIDAVQKTRAGQNSAARSNSE